MHLLKQLIVRFDSIPDKVKVLYSSGIEPDTATCNELLTSCAKKFGKVYIIFDAMDECSQASQTEVFELLAQLHSIGCQLLVSSRLHLEEDLRNTLADCKTLNISAQESDLNNYIVTKLYQKGNKHDELATQCLQLAKDNHGM
jgi:hypothetical protein